MDERERTFPAIVEDVLAVVTLISLIGIAGETAPGLSEYRSVFEMIELVVVAIFLFEYLVRIVTAKRPLSYMASFYGIVDLLSIMPTILGFGNLSFLKSIRIIRISRSFRLLRVLKLASIDIDRRKQKEEAIDFFFYLKTLATLAILFGAALYAVEYQNMVFDTLPKTLAWSTKILLGMTPLQETTTLGGQAILITAKFSGLLLFGLLLYTLRNTITRQPSQ